MFGDVYLIKVQSKSLNYYDMIMVIKLDDRINVNVHIQTIR